MVKPADISLWPEAILKTLDYPEIPLFTYLDRSVEEFPNNIALILETNSFDKVAQVTYRELGEKSDKFSAFLVDMGIKPGDKVAVFLPNMIEFVIAYYGILKSGAIVVSLNFQYPVSELQGQLIQSETKGIVCADMISGETKPYKTCKQVRELGKTPLEFIVVASVTPYLSKIKGKLGQRLGKISKKDPRDITMTEIYKKYDAKDRPKVEPNPDDVAVLMFTGGTTGTPKAAMLTHRNLVCNVEQIGAWLYPPTEKGTTVGLAPLPFYHSYGATCAMNLTMWGGSTLVCMLDPREISLMLDLLQKYRVELFAAVPTIYIALLNHANIKKYDLSNLRLCNSGAAPLPLAVIQEFQKKTGGTLSEGYGLTETSPVTHSTPMAPPPGQEKPLAKEGSIGIPYPDTEVLIIDIDTSEILGPNKEGEIAIHGPQVFAGYYKKEKETQAVMREINGKQFFLTGDIGKYDDDFYFYITDRKKDMIAVGGFKAYPREIEDFLIAHPKISNAACIGVPHPKVGETVKVFIVPKADENLTKAEILTYCRENLVKYKQPYNEDAIEFRTELPLTLVGKVLRRALKAEEDAKRGI
ncbi:MAG: long-chain fatty acid--CoA ligase [Candidatus Hodarchaeota archaeon]